MKEGWKYCVLSDCCNINYGTRVVRSKVTGDKYPVYGGGGETFRMDEYNREDCLVVSRFAMSKQCTRIVKGKFYLNDSGLTVSPKDSSKILPLLVEKYLLAYNDIIYSFGRGSAQRNLNMAEFRSMGFSYPESLPEQQRIVDYLDKTFAEIDALKAKAAEEVANAKAMFDAALKEEMTPKEGWGEKTLGEICTISGRIGFRGYTKKDLVTSEKEGAISISPSNIKDGYMDFSNCTYISWYKYEESPEIKIFNGDILIVKTGSSYGKSAIVENLQHEATINPQSVVLKNIKINNKYLAYFVRSDNVIQSIENFVSGSAIPTFSQANLAKVLIAYPLIEIQESIVTRLDSLRSLLTELEQKYTKIAAECDALKQAILRETFE